MKKICSTMIFLILFLSLSVTGYAGIGSGSISVTLPSSVNVMMDGETGNCYCSFPNIVNNSTMAIYVKGVSVSPASGWTMTGYENFDGAHIKADSDMFAVYINGDTSDNGTFTFNSSNWPVMAKKTTSNNTDELPVDFRMKVSSVTSARINENICNIVFVIGK